MDTSNWLPSTLCVIHQLPKCTKRLTKRPSAYSIDVLTFLDAWVPNNLSNCRKPSIKLPETFYVPANQIPITPATINTWLKSPQVHDQVTMETKRLRVHRFGEKISLLLCRRLWIISNFPLPLRSRHLRPRENCTLTPAHIITPPATDFRTRAFRA